eukprot:TRINITY_DN6210_c0_g1_i9.p3 TRINITY_DN6210_c0_g1~~TRINITY_DN6210_c0_g1_i9.p3  ORF type:complete len:119 (+),score=33.29 TRINITY_DN6210_c0_g1_i9:161-517(+)
MAEEKQGIQELLLNLLKSTKDEKDNDLYTHLQKVLTHIALTDPSNALHSFEQISYEIRNKDNVSAVSPYLSYKALASISQPWFKTLYDKYFEVDGCVSARLRRARKVKRPLTPSKHRP